MKLEIFKKMIKMVANGFDDIEMICDKAHINFLVYFRKILKLLNI